MTTPVTDPSLFGCLSKDNSDSGSAYLSHPSEHSLLGANDDSVTRRTRIDCRQWAKEGDEENHTPQARLKQAPYAQQVETAMASLLPRQIWAISSATTESLPHTCTPFVLPSGGVINVGGDQFLTLTQDAAFQPECSGTPMPMPIDPLSPNATEVFGPPDPFYTSTDPQIYAIAAVTAVSYMLVLMLFITPRTFFFGGVGAGGGGFLDRGGMISGSYGSNTVVGIGSRPWLQKAATLCVAVSLTIVTADTFKWAERQYYHGYQDAMELSNKVIDGLEIRIVRVISETFLWLAQAQTLIRLFPRHKEKLVIKWTAFGLISLELIFSILNFFVKQGGHAHPRRFNNAIPAMDYLFALTLNLCYAAFVFYYALCKRRFAFYHPKMWNMPLVALLSLIAVLIPVIFFILDLSKPEISGWGSYIRWVGAAAASVVVWEWVERIEALERDEKKDGILGREIFDGDEMLDASPTSSFSWGSSYRRKEDPKDSSGGFGNSVSSSWTGLAARTKKFGQIKKAYLRPGNQAGFTGVDGRPLPSDPEQHQTDKDAITEAPVPAITPVSRADTASAASTIYMVRYHPISDPTPPIPEAVHEEPVEIVLQQPDHDRNDSVTSHIVINPESSFTSRILANSVSRVLHPFHRQRDSPPLEVTQAISSNSQVNAIPPPPPPGLHPHARETSLLRRLHLKKLHKSEAPPTGVIVVPAPQQRRPLSNISSNASVNVGTAADTSTTATTDTQPNPAPAPTSSSTADHAPVVSRGKRESPPLAVLQAMRSSSASASHSSSPPPPSQHNDPTRYGTVTAGSLRISTRNTPTIAEDDDIQSADASAATPSAADFLTIPQAPDHHTGRSSDERRSDHDR